MYTEEEMLEEQENFEQFNPDGNDFYQGNLMLIKEREHEWTVAHPKYKGLQKITFLACIIALAIILFVMVKTMGAGDSFRDRLPLHISIWVGALIIYIAGSRMYNMCKAPFKAVYNARFEASDTGLHYIYQRKMKVVRYYIDDNDIEYIIRDDEANVIYIKGKANIKEEGNSGKVREETIEEIYAIVPFDEYDLDDLLEPYGEIVFEKPGTLRNKFCIDGINKTPSM